MTGAIVYSERPHACRPGHGSDENLIRAAWPGDIWRCDGCHSLWKAEPSAAGAEGAIHYSDTDVTLAWRRLPGMVWNAYSHQAVTLEEHIRIENEREGRA